MEAQPKTSLGPHTDQQTAPTNPMEKNRRPTDKLFIYLFLLIVIAWLIACISGVRTQQGDKVYDRVDQIKKFIEAYADIDINVLPSSFSGHMGTLLLGSTVLCLFCIFLIAIFTKPCMYFGWALYVLLTFVGFLSSKSLLHNCWTYPTSIVVLISILSLFSISSADRSELFDLIKHSCRTVVPHPLIISFTCLISILELPIFFLTLQALKSYVYYYNDGGLYLIYNCVIIVFGGTCILFTLLNFTVMVISDYTVNYYWKNASIIHSSVRVLRNHMGTIIFSSIPFADFVCALVLALKHKRSVKNDDDGIFYYASKLSLVLDVSGTALTFSSIYGTGFIQSVQKSFDTVLRHSLLYLNIFGAIESLIYLNAMVICFFVIIVTPSFWKLMQPGAENESPLEYEYMKLFISLVMGYICTTIVTPLLHSVKALAVNKIIILNKDDQGTERKTEVLDRL